MQADLKLLEKIARLSKLDIPEGEREKLLADFNKMLDFVAKLRTLDTTGVEPLTSMVQEMNVGRKDMVTGELSKEEVAVNAPSIKDGHFIVPKVI